MKTLFRNGLILDGSGAEPVRGDVLIENDRIAAVGGQICTDADEIIDAGGLLVCPGLIDAHSHNLNSTKIILYTGNFANNFIQKRIYPEIYYVIGTFSLKISFRICKHN